MNEKYFKYVYEWCESTGGLEVTCIVVVCKSKGEKNDGANYKEISLLSIPVKVYEKVTLERVRIRSGNHLRDGPGCCRRSGVVLSRFSHCE